MRPRLFIPAAVLCFAAGWWLDGLWDAEKGSAAKIPVAGAAGVENSRELPNTAAAAAPVPATAGRTTSTAAVKVKAGTAEELLALYDASEDAKSRARLQRALRDKTKEELSALIRDMAKMLPGDLEGPRELHVAAGAVLDYLLVLDPADGVDFSLTFSHHSLSESNKPLMEAMQKVFRQSPDKAAEILARHGGSGVMERFYWLESLADAGTEPREALEMMVEFDRKARSDLAGLNATLHFPDKYIEQDAPEAMAWALALPPGYSRRLMLGCMGHAWGRLDPAAARRYLDAVPVSTLPGLLREDILMSIGRGEVQQAAKKETPGDAP